MQPFATKETAEAYAARKGGGHVYPLFDYRCPVFRQLLDEKGKFIRYVLRDDVQKEYKGFWVTLFKNDPKPKRLKTGKNG